MLLKLKQLLTEKQQLRISLHVTPKSRKNQLTKVEFAQDGTISLKIKITGIPEKGQVNENLIKYLADLLELPTSHLKIISGFTSRHKILSIYAHALQ